MLTKPILNKFIPFSATDEKIFKFDYRGSNQAKRNNLIIEDINNGNAVVYDNIQQNLILEHRLNPNTLINGKNYRAKIRVSDTFDTNSWSQFSDYIIFWVFENPTIRFDTIEDNEYNNQTVVFKSTYSELNQDELESYRYLLYDQNRDLITNFPVKYAAGSNVMTQEIAGLQNETIYKIELITQSINGQIFSTGLIEFEPVYIVPKLLTRLETENMPEFGAVKLKTDIFQLILKLYDNEGNEIGQNSIDYIDGDWIDMNRPDYNKLVASEGFFISQSDFTLQLWCSNLPENQIFLKLGVPAAMISLVYYDDRLHAFKTREGSHLVSHFASKEFLNDGNSFTIMLRQKYDLIDVLVEEVMGVLM